LGSLVVALGPKWCSEGRFFRGQNFHGKKVFAALAWSCQELARAASRNRSGGVPIKQLKAAGGWRLEAGGTVGGMVGRWAVGM